MRRPSNKNNFDELKQSLTDEIKCANKDMDDAKMMADSAAKREVNSPMSKQLLAGRGQH